MCISTNIIKTVSVDINNTLHFTLSVPEHFFGGISPSSQPCAVEIYFQIIGIAAWPVETRSLPILVQNLGYPAYNRPVVVSRTKQFHIFSSVIIVISCRAVLGIRSYHRHRLLIEFLCQKCPQSTSIHHRQRVTRDLEMQLDLFLLYLGIIPPVDRMFAFSSFRFTTIFLLEKIFYMNQSQIYVDRIQCICCFTIHLTRALVTPFTWYLGMLV